MFSSVFRHFRTRLSPYPLLYLPIARLTKGDWVVDRKTEIVIEGFPRSGNSYAEAYFRVAQDRPVRMAHHCHAAAQVIGAAKWRIPCLVLIREPAEACRSLIMHEPRVFSANSALWEYRVFYEKIEHVRDSFILASFDAVTNNFGTVIEAINEKFGTHFTSLDPSKTSKSEIFAALNALSRSRGTVDDKVEPYSPERTDAEKARRNEIKRTARQIIMDENAAGARNRAYEVYQRLMATRDL